MRTGERGAGSRVGVGKHGGVVVDIEVTGGGHSELALSMKQRDCC